jgi:hypothetical protein
MNVDLEPDLPAGSPPPAVPWTNAQKNRALAVLLDTVYLNDTVSQIVRKEAPAPGWEITWK